MGLAVAYGQPFAVALCMKLTQDCLSFLQPQLLRRLLSFITDYQDAREGLRDERPTPLIGFSFAIMMFFASIVQTVILHQVRRLALHPAATLIDRREISISKGFLKLAFEFAPGLSPSYTKRP